MENCVQRCVVNLVKSNRNCRLFHQVRNLHHLNAASVETKTKMSAWQIHDYGSNDALKLSTATRIPSIKGPKDVLVEVHAASVNPIDVRMREGFGNVIINVLRKKDCKTSSQSEFPLTLGRDFSGVVVETGQDVTNYKPGDEVWGVVNVQKQGSHAEYTVSSLSEIYHKPKNLSHVEAASIPYVALTNWAALYSVGELTPKTTQGKRILVIAGSGGIGTFAIQLLKIWGGIITTTCSTDAVELVKEMGADEVIDYKTQDVRQCLDGMDRFDLILDTLGGNTSEEYIDYLKTWQNCKYVSIAPPFLNNLDSYGLLPGMVKSVGDFGCELLKGAKNGRSFRWGFFMPSVKGLAEVTKLVETNQIRPVVEKVFEFKDLPSAYEKLETGHSRGKTVIKMT